MTYILETVHVQFLSVGIGCYSVSITGHGMFAEKNDTNKYVLDFVEIRRM